MLAVIHTSSLSRKNLLCVKSQIMQGNEKTVLNDKFELKVDFGSVITFNTSKIMICYLLLTSIIKSNMIFMNFWHIGDFHWHKLRPQPKNRYHVFIFTTLVCYRSKKGSK